MWLITMDLLLLLKTFRVKSADEVAERLEEMVNDAKKLLQEISVIDYSKVA